MSGTVQTIFAQDGTARRAAHADDAHSWLNWLVAFHADDERIRRRFRDERERIEMELMDRPVDARRAYGLLGALLGLLPPAAIFYRVFGGLLAERRKAESVALLFAAIVLMNVVCWLVGRWAGGVLGERVAEAERGSWVGALSMASLCGLAWAILTGAAGGAAFFGFGVVFGPFFAAPVGVAGFMAFTILHRLHARGGMIEARHLGPLAWGVTLTLSALILGM